MDADLSARDLAPYSWPSDEEQARSGVAAVFLGYYMQWDPHLTYEIAKRHGFRADEKPRTGFYSFADVDDEFLITIHHWMKWYKFGFTRIWDNLSLEIRAGRMTREQAIEIVRSAGEEYPIAEIERFCDYVQITQKRFFEIAETFRNHEIWSKAADGKWRLNGFLLRDWDWR